MSEHTKLPWQEMDWHSDSQNRWACIAGNTDRTDYDMRIEFSNDIPEEEQEANAEYIVKTANAFPDLVKALKDASKEMSLLYYFSLNHGVPEAKKPPFEIINEALKKAGV